MQPKGFTILNPFKGVYHIRDGLDAHMTLLAGNREALLFDTGYGLADLLQAVRTITPLPLNVVLSHGHYDHILGSRWFPTVIWRRKKRKRIGTLRETDSATGYWPVPTRTG
ncbi:MAG TPA: MBL fold metallo-hydrolase [Candidatus Limiplasma sp.]|nr:MBL fold metallo-hydrolase [Candidatus Limiplasma sp.]